MSPEDLSYNRTSLQEDHVVSKEMNPEWASNLFGLYTFGPILPFPLAEKKLDFSPSLVAIKRPMRKIVGTATKRRLAIKPKLVVSISEDDCSEKVSLTRPIKGVPFSSRHWA